MLPRNPWNALIYECIGRGDSRHAISCYKTMSENSLYPDDYTFVALLKACAKLRDLDTGYDLHAQVVMKGLLTGNNFIGTALVDMYSKCGSLIKAQEVFDLLPEQNIVAWNAIIAGYAQHEQGRHALHCFEQMQLQGVSPSAVTYVCILKACTSIGAVEKGSKIHAEIMRKGLFGTNQYISNALLDMYAKCGMLAKALQIFDDLLERDVVSWNALISGFVGLGYGEDALKCFEQMLLQGVSPNTISFLGSLKACGIANYIHKGYAELGCYKGVFRCHDRMQIKGFIPDSVTIVCILKACGSAGLIGKGKRAHLFVEENGLLETNQLVGNALVDMYTKFGMLDDAKEVFEILPFCNIITWTTLITGYAQLGLIENAFGIFVEMLNEGILPNPVTFVSILNACSHVGLIEIGHACFEVMIKSFRIPPTVEHHTCMIDLLGRAGQLDSVMTFMLEKPSHPNVAMWLDVLGACRKWENVELAQEAFTQAMRLEGYEPTTYVCMWNIYSGASLCEM